MSLPMTGKRMADMIVSDPAAFAIDRRACGLKMLELAPTTMLEEVTARTGTPFAHALETA